MTPEPDGLDRPLERPRRLTLSEIVELLLQRGQTEHSSVTLSRNSRGITQIEVVVRTGDTGDVQTIEEAEAAAAAVYDRLAALYVYPTDDNGSEGKQ